jgi:glycerol kinase
VFQTLELITAMNADGAPQATELRVDGGMVGNNLMAQMLADVCSIAVVRPRDIETTALGAAFLAALGAGQFRNLDEAAQFWKGDRTFTPNMAGDLRDRKIARWNEAVRKLLA